MVRLSFDEDCVVEPVFVLGPAAGQCLWLEELFRSRSPVLSFEL